MRPIQKISSSSPEVQQSLRSVREALQALGGKWKIPILVSLACGGKRFKEIQLDISGITSKVLSRELKELEMNNLVTRESHSDTGLVFYSITSKCSSLHAVIHGLKEWGDYHRTNIFKRPIKTISIPAFDKNSENEAD